MIRMLGLDQTCDVFTRNATTGDFDVAAGADIACRLSHVSTTGLGAERAAANRSRVLLYGPDSTIPPGAEVLVEGERWKTVAGSQAALRGPSGDVVYQRIDCEHLDA